MDLSKINEVTSLSKQKEVIKFVDLQEGTLNKIVGARIVSGPFGDTVLLELEDKQLFLPKRCTEPLKNELECLKSGEYSLLYQGQKNYKGKSTPVFEFKLM